MLVLSVYVLLSFLAERMFSLTSETVAILVNIDNIICIFFLIDFVWQYKVAKSKWQYLKWGWIDLISSIPNLSFFRLGRLFRILRILRGIRSMKRLVSYAFSKRTKNIFLALLMIMISIILFSSIMILEVEMFAPEAKIKNYGDAVWWSVVTISTVGYGDLYPVTWEGKLIASILMISGVGLFGTFTAFLASVFMESEEKKVEEQEQKIIKELEDIKKEIARKKNNSVNR